MALAFQLQFLLDTHINKVKINFSSINKNIFKKYTLLVKCLKVTIFTNYPFQNTLYN